MGSYRKAVMTGFICRLCSEQKKSVTHLYSKKASELSLMEKIKMLPITVDKFDNLPKTVCDKCIERLNVQFNLVQKIRKSVAIKRIHSMFHSNGGCPVQCPLYGIEELQCPLHRLEEQQNPPLEEADDPQLDHIINIISGK